MSREQAWNELPSIACISGGTYKSRMSSMLFCKVKVILQKQVRASAYEGCAISVLSFSWLHCSDNGCLAVDSDIGIELLEGSMATGSCGKMRIFRHCSHSVSGTFFRAQSCSKIGLLSKSSLLEIENVELQGCGVGISCQDYSISSFRNSSIFDCHVCGIQLKAAARLFLENVKVGRCGDCNLTTCPGITSHLVATNCSFLDAKTDGVYVTGCTRALFRSCRFSGSKRYGANALRSGQSVSIPLSFIGCSFEKCFIGMFVGDGACVYALRTQVTSCGTGLNFTSNCTFSISTCCISNSAVAGINFDEGCRGTIGDTLVHSSAQFGCFIDKCQNVNMVRMTFENCPVGILLKKNGCAILRTLLMRKCATGIKLSDESNVEILGSSSFNCGIMLNASRGSNAKATNCFMEGAVSLETRSKAYFANCTIASCSWQPTQKDRLQMQINRLQQQPAITCESAAQIDLRAVSILNYDTALSAQHKDSKIHVVCCRIHGCSDAAVEVILLLIVFP